MSVFRKFSKNDILFTTVHSKPRVNVVYGEDGWTGNSGVSGSLSLYGGVRSRSDVKQTDLSSTGLAIYPLDPIDTHSIDKVIFASGSYPSTGSITIVDCDNENVDSDVVTQTQWHSEHYRPIELLYEFYNRINNNYFIGNYDFYSSLFIGDALEANRSGSAFVFSGALSGTTTIDSSAAFTIEAWYKPYNTSSVSRTIMCQRGIWSLRVTGSDHEVSFSTGDPDNWNIFTNSSIEVAKWNHIAVTVTPGSPSWTKCFINGVEKSQRLVFPAIPAGADSVPLIVGGLNRDINGVSDIDDSAEGFIFETKIWNRALSDIEIAQSYNNTLISSASADLMHYCRFNDGPYGTSHGFAAGSGAFDHSPRAKHGHILTYSPFHQVNWQPNDNSTFVVPMTKTNVGNDNLKIIHIPSMFYGKQIDPGSVVIKDGTYNRFGIVRTFVDDGIGGLYVSGSMLNEVSGEHYKGDSFTKIGNVFYSEGLIVFTDPALLDIFNVDGVHWDSSPSLGISADLISIEFRGQTKTNTKMFNCRLPTAQVNASNNPTFSYRDSMGTVETDDDRTLVLRDDKRTYISAIGLYNEDRKLIAVAKLAQPVRKREKDKINIRLKFDIS